MKPVAVQCDSYMCVITSKLQMICVLYCLGIYAFMGQN